MSHVDFKKLPYIYICYVGPNYTLQPTHHVNRFHIIYRYGLIKKSSPIGLLVLLLHTLRTSWSPGVHGTRRLSLNSRPPDYVTREALVQHVFMSRGHETLHTLGVGVGLPCHLVGCFSTALGRGCIDNEFNNA